MITLRTRRTLVGLDPIWRDLEARADCSFFQTWRWVGCLAERRFQDPLVFEASEDGRVIGLALFNRRGRTLWLHESGDPALDCPYIEQNGILAEAGREAEVTTAILRAATRTHRVVLSGVSDLTRAVAEAVAGLTWVVRAQSSPFIDLASLRQSGAPYLAGRSANTRAQIRRSDRWYAARGPIVVAPAGSVADALRMLAAMEALHQATWTARGKPGAFAPLFFRQFHQSLLQAAWASGEVTLWEISSGGTTIGLLYIFQFRRQILIYQNGFAYETDATAARPGLTSHHAAIHEAVIQGFDQYDFLAGDDRYKRSLAEREHRINWLETGPVWLPLFLIRYFHGFVRQFWNNRRNCRDSLQMP